MKTEQQKNDELEIRSLIEKWARAVESKDSKAIVESYTNETVLYDAIPPYRTIGGQAIQEIWQQVFPHFPDKFRSEHDDLKVHVDGDVAFAYGMHHFVPEPADHPCGATWMRVTACFEKHKGEWRVVHEHVSVPFDPQSGQAAFIQSVP